LTGNAQQRRLLLVEGGGSAGGRIDRGLVRAGFEIESVPRAEAIDRLRHRVYDATVVPLEALGADPVGGLRTLRRAARRTPLVLLCGAGEAREAVRLLRHGADDYLLRPGDVHEIRSRLGRILDRSDLDSRITFFQDEVSKRHAVPSVEARSPAMRTVREQVLRVAPMRSTVLIQGESGVGKELVARAVHFNSPRKEHPFIALNCAAIPASLIESELFGHEKGAFTGAHARLRGKFEIANHGTLFLDEIAEMGPATQSKLLRVLEGRDFMRIGGDRTIEVDVRVIAATNADLEEMVAARRFRRDLYYRLKVVILRVPPLRERREDIPSLVETFLDQLARSNAVPRKTIDPEALAVLCDHGWPGNVRELKNLLESLLVSTPGSTIAVGDLPSNVHRRPHAAPPDLEPGTTLAAMERELIRRTLEQTGGNRTHSADLLGIGVRTLQRKIRGYGLSIPPRRRRSRRRDGGRERTDPGG
jgi:DNA-binding NtrC family response regulator